MRCKDPIKIITCKNIICKKMIRTKFKRNQKGFSLVELIIVIAIMVIIAAAIAPALIRYINKARKGDDVATADAIGRTFEAAITSDDSMYDWVVISANPSNLSPGSGLNRVIAYADAVSSGFDRSHFHLIGINDAPTSDTSAFADHIVEYIGTTVIPMKFHTSPELEQWIICVDENRNLSVWAGGGLSSNSTHIGPTGAVTGSSYRAYKLWPEVDATYSDATSPKDLKN